MKQFSLKILLVLSCLTILATLSIFGQRVEINKRPLQDFASLLNEKLESKEIDLDKSFSITLDGFLNKDGRLEAKRSRFTKMEGDEKMVNTAKIGVEAVSDTGIFAYLQQLGVEKIKIVFAQNESEVSALITSELPTAERARTVSSGMSGLFAIAKMVMKGTVEESLLNASAIQTQERNSVINFIMPKEEAHRLLKNELQKQKEKSYSTSGE